MAGKGLGKGFRVIKFSYVFGWASMDGCIRNGGQGGSFLDH